MLYNSCIIFSNKTVKRSSRKRKLKFVFGIAYHTCARAFISLYTTFYLTIGNYPFGNKAYYNTQTRRHWEEAYSSYNTHLKNICLICLLKNKHTLRAPLNYYSFCTGDSIKVSLDNFKKFGARTFFLQKYFLAHYFHL